MTKTLIYVPLDERPCNFSYPLRLFTKQDKFKILTPPRQYFGKKKTPADISAIRQFILEYCQVADALIYSTEMLVFGGLLPSRVYEVTQDMPNISGYQSFITLLKEKNPNLAIYASNLIMRTPNYNSDDEEPSYYQDYGSQIFRYGVLKDKSIRDGLKQDEEIEWQKLKKQVPIEILHDYEARRIANLKINLANLTLVKSKKIDYLVIPQDDSAPYGYTAMDQAKIYPQVKKSCLQNQIAIYPGADESGYTLLARAVQYLNKRQLSIYPFFSSETGKTTIPLYEDRPLVESLESHIIATGAHLVQVPTDADIILAVNTPGKKMIEASAQMSHFELTYDTFRNLRVFVSLIKDYLKAKKAVAVADSAYANGADLELISMLDESGLISKLDAYRGWNTNCNTLGSTIATAIIMHNQSQKLRTEEIINALLDDGFYQAIVRADVTKEFLPKLQLNYFDLKDKDHEVAKVVTSKLQLLIRKYLSNTIKQQDKIDLQINFPWKRMFEIEGLLNFAEVSLKHGE